MEPEEGKTRAIRLERKDGTFGVTIDGSADAIITAVDPTKPSRVWLRCNLLLSMAFSCMLVSVLSSRACAAILLLFLRFSFSFFPEKSSCSSSHASLSNYLFLALTFSYILFISVCLALLLSPALSSSHYRSFCYHLPSSSFFFLLIYFPSLSLSPLSISVSLMHTYVS